MVLVNYLLMCLIFGTTYLVIKIGIDAGAPPLFSAGIRFLLAGSILFFWMVLGKRKVRLSLLFRKEMFLIGAGMTFGVFATLYWAEQYLSSGVAAVLSAPAPLMILLIQSRISRQKLSISDWSGCIVGSVGVILLLLPGITISISTLWILGCIAILIGLVGYSAGAIYSRRVIQRFEDTSPIALNAVQMMYGGGMLLILSLLTEDVQLTSLLAPNAILSLLYLMVVGSMMGHTIFYWLVAKTNPVFPTTWLYISPLIALILGMVLYDEPLSFLSVIGGILIIFGIVLVNMNSLRQLAGKKTTVLSNAINSHSRK